MKIEECLINPEEFCVLEPGDVFYTLRIPDGTPIYYMKIAKVFNYNAVNLRTGALTEFGNHDLVTEHKCILVADDE